MLVRTANRRRGNSGRIVVHSSRRPGSRSPPAAGNLCQQYSPACELGWAGLLESPYDTPSSPQDDATTADDPDEVEAEARALLNFVGQDADAGAVWAAAINDSDLTAETRQQLIEALDVSGLPDLQRLTPEYLPLILSRLAIVEQLPPRAR